MFNFRGKISKKIVVQTFQMKRLYFTLFYPFKPRISANNGSISNKYTEKQARS